MWSRSCRTQPAPLKDWLDFVVSSRARSGSVVSAPPRRTNAQLEEAREGDAPARDEPLPALQERRRDAQGHRALQRGQRRGAVHRCRLRQGRRPRRGRLPGAARRQGERGAAAVDPRGAHRVAGAQGHRPRQPRHPPQRHRRRAGALHQVLQPAARRRDRRLHHPRPWHHRPPPHCPKAFDTDPERRVEISWDSRAKINRPCRCG